MSNPVTQLQDAVAARLSADSTFAGPPAVTVLTQRAGDLLNQVERNLGKLGLCAVVMVPKLEPGPARLELRASVMVALCESVTKNRASSGTHVPSDDLVLSVFGLLADWAPEDGAWRPLQFVGAQLRDPEDTSADIVWEASFLTSARMKVEVA
jgi:hypothetical protein